MKKRVKKKKREGKKITGKWPCIITTLPLRVTYRPMGWMQRGDAALAVLGLKGPPEATLILRGHRTQLS